MRGNLEKDSEIFAASEIYLLSAEKETIYFVLLYPFLAFAVNFTNSLEKNQILSFLCRSGLLSHQACAILSLQKIASHIFPNGGPLFQKRFL